MLSRSSAKLFLSQSYGLYYKHITIVNGDSEIDAPNCAATFTIVINKTS